MGEQAHSREKSGGEMNLSERDLNREKIQPSPAQPEAPPAEDEIDLFDYIEVIVRRRWLIFWAVVICALASFGYGRSQRVSYRAEVNVLPSQERNLDIDAKSAASPATMRRTKSSKIYSAGLS